MSDERALTGGMDVIGVMDEMGEVEKIDMMDEVEKVDEMGEELLLLECWLSLVGIEELVLRFEAV